MERVFSTAGVHPYDELEWENRDVVMKNWRDGTINFEQNGVEFPSNWSVNASNIVTTKYFRGALGTQTRETSLRQVIDRVVHKYTFEGLQHRYFETHEAEVFADELTWLLVNQYFSFNSPVWFNVGTDSKQQISACFILSVDDNMPSILNWITEEGMIFKGGSGAGVNLSKLRGSRELLSSGGIASGPVSFMRAADSNAGAIKSGGATRRAAKMVILDVDHPDIEDFITVKAREEKKIRVLRDAGFDMDLGGEDYTSVQYQNANNSVRVSDTFMRSVRQNNAFELKDRSGDEATRVNARDLFVKIAEAAWDCADPGIQFDDTINSWHTCPADGRINASNPCSEYMHLDNTSCNLASLNLMKFECDGTFDTQAFIAAINIIITAMDISVSFGDFPTEAIGDNTRKYRQLGIGYANLGALLMSRGLPYDSDEGRELAASITSLMTGAAYCKSVDLAAKLGAYDGYAGNEIDHLRVIAKHQAAHEQLTGEETEITIEGTYAWVNALVNGEKYGFRNSQISVLAPTGTIGLAMDCDTTGIEPAIALSTTKKLVGGGSMTLAIGAVEKGLYALGYGKHHAKLILDTIKETGSISTYGMPDGDRKVFQTAIGDDPISAMGHIRMMAAVQPFLSGAISKTVNLPETATVEDVADIYMKSWELGLKAVAIYRDNCKVGQPLTATKAATTDTAVAPTVAPTSSRRKLPKKRQGSTQSFTVGGAEGFLTESSYPDGGLGEIFLKMSKQGSTLAGVFDALSIAVSIALQYGVPLETFVKKFTNMRFEPAGFTDDPDIRMTSSILDYVFRRLALDYLPRETREELGILTATERTAEVESTEAEVVDKLRTTVDDSTKGNDAPMCFTCGVKMRRAGSCHVCDSCGTTSGCS